MVINELPGMPLSGRLQHLPEIPALYFVHHDGKVVYVGRTKSLRSRWMGHHRKEELLEREGEVILSWLPMGDAGDLPEIENYFINLLKPEINGSPMTTQSGLYGEMYYKARELWDYEATQDKAIEATHPGFTCRCNACGGVRVFIDSDVGRSEESGAWGSVFMQCADCGARSDVWENF